MCSSAREWPPNADADLKELGVPLPTAETVLPGGPTSITPLRGEPIAFWPPSDQIDLISPSNDGAGTEREYRWWGVSAPGRGLVPHAAPAVTLVLWVREYLRDLSSGVRSSLKEPGTNSSRSSSSTTISPLNPSVAPPVGGSGRHACVAPKEAAMPERALRSSEGLALFSYEKKTDCAPGAEKGDVDRIPAPWEGDVPGETPLTRGTCPCDDTERGEPMGPKSGFAGKRI